MPKSVDFIATCYKRSQDNEGEWTITLKAPASEDRKISKLSPFFSECTVKVTVEMHEGQEPMFARESDDDGDEND